MNIFPNTSEAISSSHSKMAESSQWVRARISLVSNICEDNTLFRIEGEGYCFTVRYYELKALTITLGKDSINCSTVDGLRLTDICAMQFWQRVTDQTVIALIDGNAKCLRPEVRIQNLFHDEYSALFFIQETLSIGNYELANQMLKSGICVNIQTVEHELQGA